MDGGVIKTENGNFSFSLEYDAKVNVLLEFFALFTLENWFSTFATTSFSIVPPPLGLPSFIYVPQSWLLLYYYCVSVGYCCVVAPPVLWYTLYAHIIHSVRPTIPDIGWRPSIFNYFDDSLFYSKCVFESVGPISNKHTHNIKLSLNAAVVFPNIDNAIELYRIYENWMLRSCHYHIYFIFISHKLLLCMTDTHRERQREKVFVCVCDREKEAKMRECTLK